VKAKFNYEYDNTISFKKFPFKDMDEFSAAFKNGIAEPVIPGNFARDWASKDPNSSVKTQVTVLNRVLPLLFFGLIIYLTFKSEELKWYHSLIAIFVNTFAFSQNLSQSFRTGSFIILFGLTIYLYSTGSPFGNLIALTFGTLVSLKLADYFAFKDIVENILTNENLTTKLWDSGIMAIRYPEGKVIFKDNQIKIKKRATN
jgi:hypothetical protein